MKESFLKETLFSFMVYKKDPKDVLWVSTKDSYETWEEFAERDFDYDIDDYVDDVCILEDLIIMGKGWFFRREMNSEYGTYHWNLVQLPKKPKTHKPFIAKYDYAEEW